MNKIIYTIFGILLPFIGTSLGSSFVLFVNNMNNNIKKIMIGLSIGVMLAASFFSLLLPSINMSCDKKIPAWVAPSIGIVFGFLFLILISSYTQKINKKNIDMLLLSVTLHNIPEGMAVGVVFAGFLSLSKITLCEAILLSVGIAIQNIPEGAIISMPLKLKNNSKIKSFYYGVLSGIVEPIAALITILFLKYALIVLPYLLSFASGAMIYVIIQELIPQMNEKRKSFIGIIGVMIGFVLMMILDVAFS